MTGKHMPRSLSRIEREYVVKHMAEALPPLTVRFASGGVDVAGGAYRVERSTIFPRFEGVLPRDIADGLPCKVLFSHRQRALSFASTFSVAGDAVSIAVPEDVSTDDDRERAFSLCSMKTRIGGVPVSFADARDFPLAMDYATSEASEAASLALGKVLCRLGIAAADGFARVAALRLREYLDRITSGERPGTWSRTVLFADGYLIIVTVEDAALAKLAAETELSVELEFGSRVVACDCRLSGSVPVARGTSLACFSVSDIKPEDRRFLHENAYREKYVG